MAIANVNTGYLIQPKLKKVSDDGNNYPLDENNHRTDGGNPSGLPQQKMDNSVDSGTYKVYNTGACPI
jgi:hypothetical protein